MAQIVALGELLIDFIPYGQSATQKLFKCNPGGAPANVLAMAAKLGAQTAMISKVGKDCFGDFLTEYLQKRKIDTTAISTTQEALTTLAFVTLDKNGERSFAFCRKPGADILLSEDEVPSSLINNAKIFHFGSLSLTDEPARSATLKALDIAKQNGLIISYDPNLRPALWSDLDEARKQIIDGLTYADVVKISEEELYFISQCSSFEQGMKWFIAKGISILFVTLGAKGCYYKWYRHSGKLSTYDITVVDTTGSGDSFMGTVLYQIHSFHKEDFSEFTKDQVEIIVNFANAAGALTATKKGAIPALPSKKEILNCIKTTPKLN